MIEGPDRMVRALTSLDTEQSLRSKVTAALREAMVAGDLTPGTVYSAPALAAQLGVSATPVREAMIDLTREGLVETIRYRGYRIVELDAQALDEMIQLRELIEVPTMAQVAKDSAEESLEALRPLAEDIVRAAERGDLPAFIAADTRFHLQFLALSGNRTLVAEVQRLRGMSRLNALPNLHARGDLLPTAREHTELVDLALRRDEHGVAELMRIHLNHVRGIWAGRSEKS